MAAETPEEKRAAILFDYDLESSPLLCQSQMDLEQQMDRFQPGKPVYGGLPFYGQRNEAITNLPDEMTYFQGAIDQENSRRDAESLIYYEMKSGEKLSALAERILNNYPDLHKTGQVISVFGLSGSGKSMLAEALRDLNDPEVIVIDSDTARYNLMAKVIADAESQLGQTPEKIKQSKVIHSRITGPLYIVVEKVKGVLKQRGYTIISSATNASLSADKFCYLEHPDGIKPEEICDDPSQIEKAASTLEQRTTARVTDGDDYDWENPEQICDFRKMKPVTVQVPNIVHQRFITNVGQILKQRNDIVRISNPLSDDVSAAKRNLIEQIGL